MNAVRIHTTLNSDILHLPELKPFLGKAVDITVKEEAERVASSVDNPTEWVSPLAGSIVRDDDPFGPAVPSGSVPPTPTTLPEAPYSEWKAKFDAWMAEVKARAHRKPPGFVMDDSRESMYEGCGE